MTRHHSSSPRSATRVAGLWDGPALLHSQRRQRQTVSIVAATIAMLGLLFAVVSPPPALSQGVQLVKVDVAVVGKGLRVSKLIGTTVVNDKNETVGKLDDLVIANNNSLFAVLQVGGFLGVGSRLVVVPYESLRIGDNGRRIELPGASQDELKKMAEFKYLG